MTRIAGITVELINEVDTGRKDEFNRAVYEDVSSFVDNVLVAPASGDEIVANDNFTGRKAVYTLAIPKGDTHNWINARVRFFNQEFRTFGEPVMGIEANIPLDWNMKVQVEKYNGEKG
jgi:hypothetical protein